MGKGNLFEKLGLVERADKEENIIDDCEVINDVVTVSSESVLVQEAYEANDIDDLSSSIFKVEELISAMPKEMPTTNKRSSVLAILKTFGLTEEKVLSDAVFRTKVLESVLENVTNYKNDEISECEEIIEGYKVGISELEVKVASLKDKIATSNTVIKEELNRITELATFITGGEE